MAGCTYLYSVSCAMTGFYSYVVRYVSRDMLQGVSYMYKWVRVSYFCDGINTQGI